MAWRKFGQDSLLWYYLDWISAFKADIKECSDARMQIIWILIVFWILTRWKSLNLILWRDQLGPVCWPIHYHEIASIPARTPECRPQSRMSVHLGSKGETTLSGTSSRWSFGIITPYSRLDLFLVVQTFGQFVFWWHNTIFRFHSDLETIKSITKKTLAQWKPLRILV